MSQLSNWKFTASVFGMQTQIQFQDEGVDLGTPGTVDTVNFAGAGVTGTRVGNTVTVTIPGGAAIPTITADTTINVPADYATLADALAYVESAVVLNGAQVTITIDDTETISATVAINGENLEYLHLEGLGAGPTLDGTAFTASPFGVKAFIYAEDSDLGEIYGTWRSVNCAACAFIINVNSKTRTGSLTTAFTLPAGFGIGCLNAAGHHTAFTSTLDASSTAYIVGNGGQTNILNCTTTGNVLASNGVADINAGSIVGTEIQASDGGRVIFGTDVDVTGVLRLQRGASMTGRLGDLTEPAAGVANLITAIDASSVNLNIGGDIVCVAGSAANLVNAEGASVVTLKSAGIVNGSTGLYANCLTSAQINLYSGAGYGAFAAGASKAPYTVDAAGLIVAP